VSGKSELEQAMAVKIGSAHSEILELKRNILELEQKLEGRDNLIRCLEDALRSKQSNIEKAIRLLNPIVARKKIPGRDQPDAVSPDTTEQTNSDPDRSAHSE
jgi:hypothetical protein